MLHSSSSTPLLRPSTLRMTFAGLNSNTVLYCIYCVVPRLRLTPSVQSVEEDTTPSLTHTAAVCPVATKITFFSESQGLLQAAAGSGFIGFSSFQTPATPSVAGVAGVAGAGASPGGVKTSSGTGSGGQRRVKMAKADGGRSSGSAGQVSFMGGGHVVTGSRQGAMVS